MSSVHESLDKARALLNDFQLSDPPIVNALKHIITAVEGLAGASPTRDAKTGSSKAQPEILPQPAPIADPTTLPTLPPEALALPPSMPEPAARKASTSKAGKHE